MTEKEQLLPCPFCGGVDILVIHYASDIEIKRPEMHHVTHECNSSDAAVLRAFTGSRQEAINKWNARTISADEKEQIRRLKAFVNEIIDHHGNVKSSAGEIVESAVCNCVLDPVSTYSYPHYKKADWLKDEDENL